MTALNMLHNEKVSSLAVFPLDRFFFFLERMEMSLIRGSQFFKASGSQRSNISGQNAGIQTFDCSAVEINRG